MEWEKVSANVGTGWEQLGIQQWDGKQSGTGQTVGRETVGTGTRHRTAGWYPVGIGNRNQRRDGSGTHGRERKITWFPVPVPYRSRPDLYRAYPRLFVPYCSGLFCPGVSIVEQALAGWAMVWAAVVSVPPGHSSQTNVIRMNMVRWSTEASKVHLGWELFF